MIVGIDGCPSGWICALGTIEDNQLVKTEMRFVFHPDEIWQQYTVQKYVHRYANWFAQTFKKRRKGYR